MNNEIFEYSKEFNLTTNSRDAYKNIKLSSILDYSQEVAGEHASLLNVDFNSDSNLIWVVVRNKFEIVGNINNLYKINVKTYPLKNTLFEYPRDYEIYNYDTNELIIKGRGIWMVLDRKNNSIGKLVNTIYDKIPPREGVFSTRIKKLEKRSLDSLKEDKGVNKIKFKVPFRFIDTNLHLNNTHELDFFYDIFKPNKDFIFKSFQIEYISQSFLDDELDIYYYKNNNKYYIYSYLKDDLRFYFEVEGNY